MAETALRNDSDRVQEKFFHKLYTLAEKNTRLKRVTEDFDDQELLALKDLIFYDPSPFLLKNPVQYLLTYDAELSPLTTDRRLRALLRPKLGELIDFFNTFTRHEKILGFLLTLFPVQELSKYPIPNLKEVMDMCEIELISSKLEWWLCGSSEDRLLESLMHNNVLVLDDKLVLKFIGRITAYCLEDFINPDGFLFRKGYWYSPVDTGSIGQYVEAFKSGAIQGKLVKGRWVYMRPSHRPIGETLEELDDQTSPGNSETAIERAITLRETIVKLFSGQVNTPTFHDAVENYISQLSHEDPNIMDRLHILMKRGE